MTVAFLVVIRVKVAFENNTLMNLESVSFAVYRQRLNLKAVYLKEAKWCTSW